MRSPLRAALFTLLLALGRGASGNVEMRESEGMRYEVHRAPVSDAHLPECDLSVAYAYRERVEDAQTLLDSALKHQRGVCHMHAVFVVWDAPHLRNQVRSSRRQRASDAL